MSVQKYNHIFLNMFDQNTFRFVIQCVYYYLILIYIPTSQEEIQKLFGLDFVWSLVVWIVHSFLKYKLIYNSFIEDIDFDRLGCFLKIQRWITNTFLFSSKYDCKQGVRSQIK